MKLYSRLLLIIPLIILTSVYCKFHNPDEECQGLANLMIDGLFYILLFTTMVLAAIGVFRKRQLEKTKFEPITFSISILALLIMVIDSLLLGHTNGEKWIY